MTQSVDTQYKLSDNLTAQSGRIFLTGTQALVRMLLTQARLDKEHGLNTAGFVSGYRGSPLGGVDMIMWKAQKYLDQAKVRFQPAINEDLAASMIMGTQQAGERADRTVDGVFSMWYGKGPGVDRAGDALHHGHAAGASQHGGVLMIVGDDHVASSSSIPHASEQSLIAWGIPVVNPSSVEEYERFGIWAWALSRYSGSWVAFKAITETVESGRSFEIAPLDDLAPALADKQGGKHPYDPSKFLTPSMEGTLDARLDSVREFAHKYSLDRVLEAAPDARIGIVSTGKATLDTLDALQQLSGLDNLPAIRHLKIGLSWPVNPQSLNDFIEGLDHVLVIEEKGPIIEDQLKNLLFNRAQRPTVSGKRDIENEVLIPADGQLSPARVAVGLRRWLGHHANVQLPACTVQNLAPIDTNGLTRRPYFCSGCPHNTSTKVPEGSQAMAGVGCHYMATWMDRKTRGLTQMGGEGTDWVGLSPFIQTGHMFQNMGEGTYFHSGYLAIRQAIAAGANITYKILFNDAVAMTGGQPVDGPISVPRICQQTIGEGARRVVITTDEPERYRGVSLPAGVDVHHRRELDRLQRELREIPGVTILIHDQTCAAEKRRRRKKNEYPDPARRLFINKAVCEGCGDCGVQSNCLSLVPAETPEGRKRQIDQSSCNKDYSCVDGFCPSFVSVMGGALRRGDQNGQADMKAQLLAKLDTLPQPNIQAKDCNVIVAGVGGTGVITIGAVLSMAVHLEGRSSSVLDMTGLAQKGGTVISHIRLSANKENTGAVRVDPGQADLAILCDVVAAAHPNALSCLRPGHTHAIINEYLAPTAEFTRNPDAPLDAQHLLSQLKTTAGENQVRSFNAHQAATLLFGDSLLSNMLLMGMAWQQGSMPVSSAAVEQAIRLNGVAIQANLDAFHLGRVLAHDEKALASLLAPAAQVVTLQRRETLEQIMQRCTSSLEQYQNAAYAQRFTSTITALREAEQKLRPGQRPALTEKAARSLYKLMAYKDEYEVARLFSSPAFRQDLEQQFEGDFSLRFHFAPPLLARRDPFTGRPRKITLGPRTATLLRWMAKGKGLRNTVLDPFGYTHERRMERRFWREYQSLLNSLSKNLNQANYATALELAELPQQLRGFGPVKMESAKKYEARFAELSQQLKNTGPEIQAVPA